MKIKIFFTVVLIMMCSCSFRKKIEPFDLTYKDKDAEININITHKKKIKNSYFGDWYSYYGTMELKLINPKVNKDDIYFIAQYNNDKSTIELDVIYDNAFWRNLEFKENGSLKANVYVSFKEDKLNNKKIQVIRIDKKFKYLPLDFYEH